MRNASEAGPVRPEQRMDSSEVSNVLRNATKETHIRIWFWPLEEIDEDGEFSNNESDYLERDGDEMLDCEIEAVRAGTHIDIVVTGFHEDEDLLATEIESNYDLTFEVDDADCIHHAEVIKVGLPPAEELTVGDNYMEIYADPGKDHIDIDQQELSQSDVEQMVGVFQRWLANKR